MRKMDSIISAPAGHRLFYVDINKGKMRVDELPLIGYGLSQYTEDEGEELVGFDMVPLSTGCHNEDIKCVWGKTLLMDGVELMELSPLENLEEEKLRWQVRLNQYLYDKFPERRLQVSVRATFKILLAEGKTVEGCIAQCSKNWAGKPLTKEIVQIWIDKGMPL